MRGEGSIDPKGQPPQDRVGAAQPHDACGSATAAQPHNRTTTARRRRRPRINDHATTAPSPPQRPRDSDAVTTTTTAQQRPITTPTTARDQVRLDDSYSPPGHLRVPYHMMCLCVCIHVYMCVCVRVCPCVSIRRYASMKVAALATGLTSRSPPDTAAAGGGGGGENPLRSLHFTINIP